ncbi:MAG: amidase [Clostridia bacterium]|nr:amidase [Clostridia bacterium]
MAPSVLSSGLRELYAGLQARDISCEDLCRFYLERIEKYGMRDALNCVMAVNPKALDEARDLDRRGPEGLPLYGLGVLLKDNIDVKGLATTAGSVALKDNIADADAPFVRTLRESGAVILGKTNMTEFANFLTEGMPGGFSSLGGQVVNAYDKNHTPSGSSSGSAVAMSARLCSFAVGTDTSFSVVACATDNGVVGFKPAVGTISTEGVIPITSLLDEIGFFTRDMADMRFVAEQLAIIPVSVSAGPRCSSLPSETDKTRNVSLRKSLAVWTVNREYVSEAQLGRYEMLFDRLKADGWSLTTQPGRNTFKLQEIGLRRFSMELRAYLENRKGSATGRITPEAILDTYRKDPEKLAPYGIKFLEKSLEYEHDAENARAIESIRAEMDQEHKRLIEELSDFDCCVMTGPTCIMHFAGLTSLSIPFTVAENGLPRSVILFGTDMRKLLAVGEEIERHGDTIPMPGTLQCSNRSFL